VIGEFEVASVEKIQFSDSPFDMLTVPHEKKKVIKSLAKSRVDTSHGATFDDIIVGKGQGVIILLQYVLPIASAESLV
jgi:hypothetical protein